ncbi:hypothetical protein LB542_19900 [Mesorhizobium sp. BR1-1-9]|uniref:hypothetical protein n=1 Tax=Mesorhizobium sp. BR1-1-9 TaxID=2876646 RepID=UPI001CD0689C|nr:hypothetical protein [Mesorhizobium sp. BR1-1-9]MBZ9873115.1 hypothetical protein [Mesorhizobium sp. BR1-1-9]
MNMHHRQAIADSHSIQHEFEELEIEEEGLFLGSFWGSAELALNDPANGDFYVKHIVLKGDRYDRQGVRFGLRIRKRVPGFMALPMPAKDDQTFKAHLFRAIEARLYEDETAQAAWLNEIEDAGLMNAERDAFESGNAAWAASFAS